LYQSELSEKKLIAVAIIQFKGKVLLIQRTDSKIKESWWFPGGRVEQNEKITSALVREVKEEVGLDIEIIKPIAYSVKEELANYKVIYYLSKLKSAKDKIKLNPKEVINAKFISRNEIMDEKSEYKLLETNKKIIEYINSDSYEDRRIDLGNNNYSLYFIK